ncbi:MAG: hypothetical protein BroJett011_00670 [Chloroflexota bacterium]|nr:MAG: hypothetical protein BroJett011_00670 [Chloroflexota bacterium]
MEQTNPQLKFVICIQNEGSEDLQPRKIYQVLPDDAALAEGYIRVIDDSGEDYLYPASYFIQIELPQNVEQALLVTA